MDLPTGDSNHSEWSNVCGYLLSHGQVFRSKSYTINNFVYKHLFIFIFYVKRNHY